MLYPAELRGPEGFLTQLAPCFTSFLSSRIGNHIHTACFGRIYDSGFVHPPDETRRFKRAAEELDLPAASVGRLMPTRDEK